MNVPMGTDPEGDRRQREYDAEQQRFQDFKRENDYLTCPGCYQSVCNCICGYGDCHLQNEFQRDER